MVIISEKSVERMLNDVAPKVEKLTGWDPVLSSLNVKIVPRKKYVKYCIDPLFNGMGIDTVPKTKDGKTGLFIVKNILPFIVMGQYEPITQTLIVMGDNFVYSANESGLTAILGHELVHRCQYINNPEFADVYCSLSRRMHGKNAYDIDGDEDPRAKKYVQSLMTLLEGDASFVQEQLKKIYYQNAENKTSGLTKLFGVLFAFVCIAGGSMDKFKQYSKGKNIVENYYKRKGRQAVNDLYNLDENGLHGVFG